MISSFAEQAEELSVEEQKTTDQLSETPITTKTEEIQIIFKRKQETHQQRPQDKNQDGLYQQSVCEECGKQGSFVINRKEGTIVCSNCGLVQQQRIIDETSEWRNFSNDNGGDGHSNANRVGGKLNPFMSDFGLSTMVKGQRELEMWSQRTSMTSMDKTIQKGHQRIKEVAICLNLKDACINKAYELYKQINANNDLRGRTVDSRVATVIFMASRLVDQSKPIEKILQFTECTKQELSRTYKKVKELFPEQTQARMMASKVAESCCNTLKLPMDIVQACKQTADNLQSLSAMEGKRPQTVAGVAIMMVIQLSQVKVSIEKVAEIVNIGVSTIQDVLRQSSGLREHVLPQFWQNQLKPSI